MRKLKKYKPTAFKAKDSYYDKDAADFAVAFIENLCHTKGTWAGKRFELLAWQEQIIRDIFGILKPNGYRQFNTAYVEIPKKNGKSELAAAVALLLCCGDGEERAEVYGCAADRQQASIVFEVAADMVRMCPALSKRVKILASQKRIIYTPTNSFYQVLSAEAYSKHGFNIHGVVFDELHTQPNRKLFDVMTKGSGDARMQPLYFLITTAGTDTHADIKLVVALEAQIKACACFPEFNLNLHISPSFNTSCAVVEMMSEATACPSGNRPRNWIFTGPGVKQSVSACEKKSRKGDALLQKVYTKDFLTKEKKKNEGEVPQYYVHGSHEAIIDPKTWDLVQTKIAGRAPRENRYNSVSIYSGKIKCGDCGSWYGSKVWHSNSKYRGIIWRCNHKYDGEKCTTPKLTEGEIQGIFLRAVNKVITDRDRLLSVYETTLLPKFNTTDMEQKLSKINAELNLVGGQIQDDIKRNASVVQDQEAYRKHMTELETRQRRVIAKKEKLEAEITGLHARQQEIELYLDHLRQQDLITVFRVEDWLTMVDYVTVYSAEDIRVTFKDGTEVMA